MYTVGPLAHVHANGRINYADQPPTHADGRELGADRAFEAARRLRAAAAAASRGGEGGGEEEAEVDAALDAVLAAEMEGEDSDKNEDEEGDEDGALTPPWGSDEGKPATAAAAPAAPAATADKGEPTEKPPPPNFSRCSDPLNPDRGTFPRFPAAAPVEVAVGPGSMLYLPAGWFHEASALGLVRALG